MEQLWESLPTILVFGLLSIFFLRVARKRGFFHSPHPAAPRPHQLHWKPVLVFFTIYFGMSLGGLPLFILLLRTIYHQLHLGQVPLPLLGGAQLSTIAIIFFLFFIYSKKSCPLSVLSIWKRSTPHSKSIAFDFFLGVIAWIISFPIVVVIGQVADLFLYYFFHFEGYEQVAIRYLKNTLTSLPLLSIALFSILIAAPLLEEFLFRGCLQTFLRQKMSSLKAIFLSSLCFSLFHFSLSQGLGNISLLFSLFALALVLGWIYERQASLFASIGLHMTFNTVTTMRILLFSDL